MNREIDKYMTVGEASDRWGVKQETIKNKLKPSVKTSWAQTEKMIELGLLKFYQKSDKRKDWIVTTDAMEMWFGKKEKNN